MRLPHAILFALLLSPLPFGSIAPTDAHASDVPILLDSVIATVDEKPITLRDLERRMGSAGQSLTLERVAADPGAQSMLERMIFEEVVRAEAEARRISVGDPEVDHYMDEVARRNGLSRENLVKALEEEHKDIASYRHQIKMDILQSRLGSSYLQGSGAVTEEEVRGYLEEHPELLQSGSQVKLSRIFITIEGRAESEALARAEEAIKRLKEGESFSDVARQLSDGPEAKEGGTFGLVAEKDLSEQIFDATMRLSNGEFSEILKNELGYQIFRVEDRVASAETDREKIEEEVRRQLQQAKQQGKLQSFFTTELFKNHTVERKI